MPPSTTLPASRFAGWPVLAVFVLCLAFIWTFLVQTGATTSDLAGDPDEAAHAVTSLMVRDYLATGFSQSPMPFAQAYYADFPRVALGHYPPGYYLLSSVFLLAFPTVKTLFVVQALVAAAFSALLFGVASRMVSRPAALLAALLLVVLPVSLKQTQLIMSDTLVAALCLLAAFSWHTYLSRPSMGRALAFGLVATAAILTKGSAMGLCLIPPVATALSGRWTLLKKPSWYLSALPVILIAGPWMAYSTKISAEGMTQLPLRQFFPAASAYYTKALPYTLGWSLTLLALVGVIAFVIISRTRHHPHATLAASLCGLLGGTLLIMLAVPVGLAARYMLPGIPVLILAALFIADHLCAKSAKFRWPALCLLAVGSFLPIAAWPSKQVHGFTAAVSQSGIPPAGAATQHWLVTGDPRGEGAVIAAAAFGCPQRSPSVLRVHRGTKVLSTSDWMGRGYQSAFATEAELLGHLDHLHITRVFVDQSLPESQRKPHELLLANALLKAPAQWTLDFEQPLRHLNGQTAKLLVYRRL